MQLRACGVMLSQLVRLFPTPSGQQRAELELEAGVGVRRVLQSATRAQARISRSVEQRPELELEAGIGAQRVLQAAHEALAPLARPRQLAHHARRSRAPQRLGYV